MKIKEIYSFLDEAFPFSLALDFDNCGLLVGDSEAEVSGIVIALDCTNDTVLFAKEKGANLIITHHPIIFNGMKSVTKGSAVYTAVKNDISVISAHTNLDIADGGVNDALCLSLGLENITDFECEDGFIMRKGELKAEMSPTDFCKYAADKLNANARYTVGKEKIKTVAICSGSGSDMLCDAIKSGADAYVSSEIKHNVFLDAYESGFTCLDLGHFATERIIVPVLKDILETAFPKMKIYTFEKNIVKYI